MLTHINEDGRAHMVRVSEKQDTVRKAVAKGTIAMKPATLERVKNGGIQKGDVLAVAQVAGIMAAKKTSEIIPMCHPLFLTSVDISFSFDDPNNAIIIYGTVETVGKTGVEMEALVAVTAAGLTIYDMCKAIDKDMVIGAVMLLEKSGGKSGTYNREEA